MQISDVMTPDVRTIAPDRTVRDAARLMDELNVGVLPVCLEGRLVGMITDRDITVRSTAAGLAPDQQVVEEIMTTDLISCRADDDTQDVLRQMSTLQVRRLPVVDREGHLVGIVSLGDLAADGAPGSEEALRRISTPAEPDRSGTPSTARADATRDNRPSPLSDDERRELERRLSTPDGPRPDRGRAPDNDGQTRGMVRDEDDVRAAFGSTGSPAEGNGTGHMAGGFGGDGYAHYGQGFGPGAGRTRPATIDDVDHIGGPDAHEDETTGPEGGASRTSSAPAVDDRRAGRVLFSNDAHDDASGRGDEAAPESSAEEAAATGNPGTTGGVAGGRAGSPSGGRTTNH